MANQSHGLTLWKEPARNGAAPSVSPRYLKKSGANLVVSDVGPADVALYDVTGARDYRAIDLTNEIAIISNGLGGLRVSPSVVDRAHLDFSANVPAGTDQRVLTMITAGGFNQATTSHTWMFLLRSAAPASATQRLVSISGPTAFSIFRAVGGGYLGFGASSTTVFTPNTAPPSDDAWHTIAMRFNAVDSTATLFVDGVSVATAAYTPQSIGSATSALVLMGTVGTYANATTGRLARLAYYAGARGNTGVATDHAAMMAGTALAATPVHEWNADSDDYGTQQLTDVGSSPTAHLRLGRTSGVEVSPAYDPLWDGAGPAADAAAVIADDGTGGLEWTTDLTRAAAADLRFDLDGNIWTIRRTASPLRIVDVRGNRRFY